jgi:flavin-dependent dehydrogenase
VLWLRENLFLRMSTPEVLIIGGGPAGAAVALELARHGFTPCVLEAQSTPRLKVGECLPPSINPLLNHFRLTERLRQRVGLATHGNRFVWGSNAIEERDFIFSTNGPGWRLERQVFEEELMRAAIEAGARWCSGRQLITCAKDDAGHFKTVVKGPDGIEIYHADFVVDATGRSARLARSLSARRVVYDRLIGIASYFSEDQQVDSEDDSFTLVEAVASGWWYSSRLPGGKVIAVYMTDDDLLDLVTPRRREVWLALLNQTKHTSRRICKFSKGKPTPPRILASHTVRLTRVTGDGWLAVGDSAVAFDPLASHGIAMAMGCGFNAATAIVEYLAGRREAMHDYERLIDRAFASYLLMHHEAYVREQRWSHEEFWRRRHAREKARAKKS